MSKRIVGGLEKKQRRITVERLKSVDIYGHSVDILVVSNGVIKMVHDISPFSCWANGWNRVFVNDVPCTSFAMDYLVDSQNQAKFKVFQSDSWGPAFVSLLGKLYFLENSYDWENPANVRCPEYFSKCDAITYCIERIIGSNYPTSGDNPYVITNFTADKTPAVYICENNASERLIFRNDSGNEENYTESVTLTKSAGLFLKVIRMPDYPILGSVKIKFYVTEVSNSPKLKLRLGTPLIHYSSETPYEKTHPSNLFSYYFTASKEDIQQGWNEVVIDGDKLSTGVNWIWFDIRDSANSSAMLKIGLDTSVKSSVQNLAYHLANENASALKTIQAFYTLYRDRDVISLTPRVRDTFWWSVGSSASAGITYNFNICSIVSEFKKLVPPDNPYTRYFKMPIPHYNLAVDDVYIHKNGSLVKVTPGTEDYPWQVNAEKDEIYVDLKDIDGYQFTNLQGIKFVSRTSGFKFKVNFTGGYKPIKRLAFGITNDPSYGWYRLAEGGSAPPNFTKSNDWVFYLNDVLDPSTNYLGPTCTLDLTGIDRVWGLEI